MSEVTRILSAIEARACARRSDDTEAISSEVPDTA
jgi:hypothetical protein